MDGYRIPQLASKYLDYEMIKMHTSLPTFPDIRSRVLHIFMHIEQSSKRSSELFALATSLVQMGLDTHELVTASSEVKEKSVARSRQLKVLAGDYFSARFYQLLAQAGEIELIKQLAQAICEVNRLKMDFYHLLEKFKLTSDTYLHRITDMHSFLFLTLNEVLPRKIQHTFQEILREFTRCEMLYLELIEQNVVEQVQRCWKFWYVVERANKDELKQLASLSHDESKYRGLLYKYHASQALEEQFLAQVEQLKLSIQRLDDHALAQKLQMVAEPFYLIRQQTNVTE